MLEELAPLFEKETGVVLRANLGSTGQLMEQIAAGAKVDVFLAASSAAIEQLDEKGLLVPDSTRLYARGQLVMWTPPDSKVTVGETFEDLADATVTRMSIANPDHAPYGKAAKEALESAACGISCSRSWFRPTTCARPSSSPSQATWTSGWWRSRS